jgi:lipocalin-like protein
LGDEIASGRDVRDKEAPMSQRGGLFRMAGLAVFGLAVLAGHAVGQHKSLTEQLLGAWTLVSIDYVRPDGSRLQTFGPNPTGLAIFDGRGYFVITVMRSDRPAFALNDRMKGTAEENQATAQGAITYFGTYSVNEADRTIGIHIVGSSFPNWNGSDQKRIFTVTGDELKLTNPVGSTGGGTAEVVWKRAK